MLPLPLRLSRILPRLFLVSSGDSPSWALLGLKLHHSSQSHGFYLVGLCVYVWPSPWVSSSLKDTSPTGLRAHPTPV
uniref:Uncharacterized protein n=2 Tax=Sus scrofa TaxID=9823 RepID=A0A4X1VHR5_PIG